MTELHPMNIKGNWAVGRVLDWHVTSSEFIGYNEYGHPQFDTKYTELGELVYKFKYKHDRTALPDILNTICSFGKFKSIDAIIPVPPSDISRKYQPVVEIAQQMGKSLEIHVFPHAVRKIESTPQLKNVATQQERYDILKDAFEVVESSIQGKIVLVLDDLYRSGATLRAITDVLYKQGKVSKVKVLALTMTKRR